MPGVPMQQEKLEFKSNQLVSGVDFGYQMVDRWYTINKVPSPFGAQTLHFAPPNMSHSLQQNRYMCTMPQVAPRRKHVIFFFDSDELERLAQRNFPLTVALKNITDDMLRTLTDCEVARVKVGKSEVTFYVYAVKWKGRAFERMQELCDLLRRLPSIHNSEDCHKYTLPKSLSGKGGLMSRGHNSGRPSQQIDRSRDHLQDLLSQEETSKLLKISPKCRTF
ncbi:hypothetical protein Mapa_014374 [Marchantia paleacea]|nr:hypothetical protein Mapa_014374 [Marchantia paleacea]